MRVSATPRRFKLVEFCFCVTCVIKRRTVLEQTVDKKRLGETHRILANPTGIEYVDVQRSDFDVLDAPSVQGCSRALTRAGNALWSHGTVILVFDLQLICIQLPVHTIDFDADIFIRRLGRSGSRGKIVDVTIDVIQADIEKRLGLIVVPEIAHTQGRTVRFIPGLVVERWQVRSINAREGLAQCR